MPFQHAQAAAAAAAIALAKSEGRYVDLTIELTKVIVTGRADNPNMKGSDPQLKGWMLKAI